MPSKPGSSSTLTFFVMFRHARIIGGHDADFNKRVTEDANSQGAA
jgi:hypothetical protein